MNAKLIATFIKSVAHSENHSFEGAPCWDHSRMPRKDGYRQFYFQGKRGCYVHRVAYELFYGPIPDGHDVDHRCRNRGCCNPAHLQALPISENRAQGFGGRTHCKHGHPFDEVNTYVTKSGGRVCRPCVAARVAVYNAANPDKRHAASRAYEERRAARRRQDAQERYAPRESIT